MATSDNTTPTTAAAAAVAAPSASNLVWIDCEMTGLDTSIHRVIEIACIVTDSNLNIIATGFDVIVHQPESVLEKANPWVQENMASLLSEVRKSTVTTAECEQQLLAFLEPHIVKGKSPLAGNTVYMDKRFLEREFPLFVSQLHYRIVDVSTVKELTQRWLPSVFARAPKKLYLHRALSDIEESIKELKFYHEEAFVTAAAAESAIDDSSNKRKQAPVADAAKTE